MNDILYKNYIFIHITDSMVPVVLCLLIEKGLSVVSLMNFM